MLREHDKEDGVGGRKKEGSQRREVANLFMARMRLYVGRGASTDKVEPKKMLQTLFKAKENFKIPTKRKLLMSDDEISLKCKSSS